MTEKPWLYRNNKTGIIYERMFTADNATNGVNNQSMVVYKDIKSGDYYCRERHEFICKFTEIKTPMGLIHLEEFGAC